MGQDPCYVNTYVAHNPLPQLITQGNNAKESLEMRVLVLLFVLVGFGGNAQAGGPDWKAYTGVLQQRQDTPQWCWASVVRAVAKHNADRSPTQCKLASRWVAGHTYESEYCCTGPNSKWGRPTPSAARSNACVKPFSVTTVLDHYGVYKEYKNHPVDPAGISGVETQLKANLPPVAVVSWNSGGAHAITIVSGVYKNGTTTYELYDPWDHRVWVKRTAFKKYKNAGKWTATIHTKKAK